MLVRDRDLNQDVFENVCASLEEMGLGHLDIELFTDGGDNDNTPYIKVSWGEGAFGNKMEELDRWFNLDLFLMFFRGRNNYLKLTEDERSKITMHPQMWEREFLVGNVIK